MKKAALLTSKCSFYVAFSHKNNSSNLTIILLISSGLFLKSLSIHAEMIRSKEAQKASIIKSSVILLFCLILYLRLTFVVTNRSSSTRTVFENCT